MEDVQQEDEFAHPKSGSLDKGRVDGTNHVYQPTTKHPFAPSHVIQTTFAPTNGNLPPGRSLPTSLLPAELCSSDLRAGQANSTHRDEFLAGRIPSSSPFHQTRAHQSPYKGRCWNSLFTNNRKTDHCLKLCKVDVVSPKKRHINVDNLKTDEELERC